MTTKKEKDAASGMETTGHEWDGIKELNTPLPRWWLWIFYATVIWAIGYWVLYPSWPLLTSYTPGTLNHSQREDVARAVQALKSSREANARQLTTATLEQIEADPNLQQFALQAGKSAFGDNCATCHGSGAQGFKGYPNLNDDVWLWGGKLEDIKRTIRFGIRADHAEARQSQMPAYGRDQLLERKQIDDLVQYVLSVSGRKADAAAVTRAAPVYKEQCAACHGDEAKGNREFGAPNLTDKEWLYGGSAEEIHAQIVNGRGGVMPTWDARLEPATIDALAVYVHSLGGGE